MSRAPRILCFGVLAVLSTCKSSKSGSSALDRVAHDDTAPTGDQTYTDARVASLNTWATSLLSSTNDHDDFQTLANQYFANAGITDTDPLSKYRIALRAAQECFHEEWFGNNIYWDSQRDAMRKQIESAAVFLLDFHKATLGKPRGAFAIKEIEICPEHVVGQSISLKAQTLVIGIPRTTSGTYDPLSSDKIRQLWDRGDHLTVKTPASTISNLLSPPKLLAIWQIFNPIGVVRTNLRMLLADQGAGIAKRLDPWARVLGLQIVTPADVKQAPTLQGKPADGLKAAQELHDDVIKGLIDVKRLGMNETTLLATLQGIGKDGSLPLLVQNWLCASHAPRYADDLATSALGVFEQTFRGNKSKAAINIQSGLVSVGNYHKIDVSFAAGVGGFENFIQKPAIKEDELNLNVNVSSGLVSVFTVDEINVQASATVMKEMAASSIETLSLKMALAATGNKVNLCEARH